MAAYEMGSIGTGNMGGTLARAAVRGLGREKVLLSDKLADKAASLAQELGCASDTVQRVAEHCRFIMLGVKPQMMADMLAEIAPVLAAREERFVLVTMAAGLTMEQIGSMAGGNYPIIRIMPNTPASIGEGMILYTANQLVTDQEMSDYLQAMRAAGRFDRLDEKLFDAGGSVSGCGPAFAYLFIEALSDGGVACGLPRAQAMQYAAQMMVGAAKLVLESGQHPGALKDAVCSPGGSTIAGVRALEEKGFRAACMDAVIQAVERTKELGM